MRARRPFGPFKADSSEVSLITRSRLTEDMDAWRSAVCGRSRPDVLSTVVLPRLGAGGIRGDLQRRQARPRLGEGRGPGAVRRYSRDRHYRRDGAGQPGSDGATPARCSAVAITTLGLGVALAAGPRSDTPPRTHGRIRMWRQATVLPGYAWMPMHPGERPRSTSVL
jgi:hypothetical protein